MKIKLLELKGIETGLQKLIDKELNIRVAYRIGKLLKVVTDETASLEDSRNKLIQKYGETIEATDASQVEGQPPFPQGQQRIQVKPENQQKFYNELSELLQEEVEISFEQISLNDLEGVILSPKDMFLLDPVIKAEVEDIVEKIEKEEEKEEEIEEVEVKKVE